MGTCYSLNFEYDPAWYESSLCITMCPGFFVIFKDELLFI